MSSIAGDMTNDHRNQAQKIQDFMWEGKPFKSKKKTHTIEEYEDFLESLRTDSWNSYDFGAVGLGWRNN